MKQVTNLALGLAVLGMTALSTGCLLAGNYHSAKTLNKGESSFGLTFTAVTYEINDATTGETARVSLPALLPEVTFHVGLQDNLEVGGRVGLAQLAMEADVKYRFLKADKLHLAVAPAISAQSLILISGTTLKLPGIATYELSDNVALTGAVFGAVTRYGSVNADDADDDLAIFSGSLGAAGGSVFLELAGESFAIRPGVEYTRYSLRFGDGDSFDAFNTISVMVHLSFIRGREKLQLNRIEDKLDRTLGVP